MHTKTTLKCKKCGKYIYSDEGYIPLDNLTYEHSGNCEQPKRPNQCKQYNPTPEYKKGVSIPTNEQMIKEKAGFHYES